MDIVLIIVWARGKLSPFDDLDGMEFIVSPSAQNPGSHFDGVSRDLPASEVVLLATIGLLLSHLSAPVSASRCLSRVSETLTSTR